MEGEIAQVSTETAVPAETVVSQAIESQETPQDNSQTEHPAENQDNKPAGFDPVEFNPDQKARFDRVYGNMKRYEQTAKEMKAANDLLADQLRVLNENQGKIVTHLQHEDFRSAEQQLKDQRAAAWQAGDSKSYDEANDKLRDLSVKKAMAEMQPPKQTEIQQPRRVSVEDTVDDSVRAGKLTHEEGEIYKGWQNESDQYGNVKRTWINPSDPLFQKALRVGSGVLDSPAMQNKSLGEKLKEIDKLMGMPQQVAQQNVLPGGNLTAPRKNNNVKLSDYEMKIAIKTKFGGPKAKSDADHAEAYRQAKIESQQKRATR